MKAPVHLAQRFIGSGIGTGAREELLGNLLGGVIAWQHAHRDEHECRHEPHDQQVQQQQKELEQARLDRERLLKELPKSMSTLYKRISARIRDGVAVAEARNGACTACYMALRPQIMADVRRGDEVITCDNCNRILYYNPDKAARPVAV